MTTNTMVALRTVTVTGSTTTAINLDLTGITGYTDLFVVLNLIATGGSDYSANLTFNGDTGNNYSRTLVRGDGSTASSLRYSSAANIDLTSNYGIMTTPSVIEINLMNYANTTTYKTALVRYSQPYGTSMAEVCMWRGSTGSAVNQPITSLNIAIGSTYFAAGSTATVYGIANADIGAYATGGVITQDANYYYHAFGNSSYFTPTRNLTADILVVAGGGGGGNYLSGGGGAGGLLAFSSQSLTNGTAYTCTVGAGGAGGASGAGNNGANGGNSQFASISGTVYGGGYGSSTTNGGNGGSGGGGAGYPNGTYSGGTATSGQGHIGGNGNSDNATYTNNGGGGGAGTNGANSTAGANGNGGNGVSTYSSWLSAAGLGVLNSSDNLRYIAGGGGGGGQVGTAGVGGLGGGGNGVVGNGNAYAGVANTGSGGGGCGAVSYSYNGGNGGSGLIIIRYSK